MSSDRIKQVKKMGFKSVYVSIRAGITGSDTIITSQVEEFLEHFEGLRRCAGFGINSKEHIVALSKYAEVAVVGSYFTREITNHPLAINAKVKQAMMELIK